MLCTHMQGVALLISLCVINLQRYSGRSSTLHMFTNYCTKLIYPDPYHVAVGLSYMLTEHLLGSYFCLHFVVSSIFFPVSSAKCTLPDSLHTVYNCVFSTWLWFWIFDVICGCWGLQVTGCESLKKERRSRPVRIAESDADVSEQLHFEDNLKTHFWQEAFFSFSFWQMT